MFYKSINKKSRPLISLIGITAASLAVAQSANATIVEFMTSQGNIQVNLFDTATPKTVANFLSYVDAGHYTDSVIHRSVSEFVIQGGGYSYEGWPLTRLVVYDPVENEPFYSNVAGTIAMAKVGNSPDSATDQWFFNLADNSNTTADLDLQNSGFTVFGQIIGDESTATLNKIAALNVCASGDHDSIPMIMEEDQVCSDLVSAAIENFVVLEQVVVIDSSEATADDLNPLLTKYPDSDGDGVKDIEDAFPSDPDRTEAEVEEDSGGSTTLFSVVMLTLLALRKRFLKR